MSALAHAQLLHRGGSEDADGALANRLERAVQAVKQAVSQCPSYDVLIPALLKYPLEVKCCHWLLLVCASSMLCNGSVKSQKCSEGAFARPVF